MSQELKGMNLLVFAPSFFSYEKAIVEKLKSMDAEVIFFDERPLNSTFGKSILRISKKLSQGMIYKYYRNIQKEINNRSFDQILFFQAEGTPKWFLEYINRKYENSRKILYLWDSVSDKPDCLLYKDFYDAVYTFDPEDSKQFDLKFRPLFYTDDYLKKPEKATSNPYKYDFSFIGTVRKDRYDVVQKLKYSAEKSNQNYYIFYYLQSKLLFYFYRFFCGWFKTGKLEKKDFSFTPLSHNQIQKIISQTKILIDIQKPHQVGLTIRTLELLASNKKFVTTNAEIIKYNFYSNHNIGLLSRETPKIEEALIESEFIPVNPSVMQQYSIGFFLMEILGFEEAQYYNF